MKISFLVLFSLAMFSGCKKEYFSPAALLADPMNSMLYIAGATSDEVVAMDPDSEQIEKRWKGIPFPSGLCLDDRSSKLFVTCAIPDGKVAVLDVHDGTVLADLPAGHTPMSPLISRDGKVLFICNRFNNDVWMIDIENRTVLKKIAVKREPVAMAMDQEGRFIFVANHLPAGPANTGETASVVSVIDISEQKVVSHIPLPNGSSSLRGICMSPDDRYLFVTHILAKYQLPTTQLERGWMNTNALSIIEAKTKTLFATLPLDDVDRGAANPWGVFCSPDGRQIFVTHAGTHELSVIDAQQLFAKLNSGRKEVFSDLVFLAGISHRISLPGKGPRDMALIKETVFIGEYFSDQILAVRTGNIDEARISKCISLSNVEMDADRRGEVLFNDASLCFQNWQSCASCHPDVRTDGMNWDLLNDGIGNPKNTKSLLLSMRTPPAMISGIRDYAETAVRAGFHFIHFTTPDEKDLDDIDAFLDELKPVSSPFLQNGRLSEAARRGKKIYSKTGCATCHPGPLFSDLKKYNVGSGTGSEKNLAFDTPTLVEIWRTAPYLYDGRAVNLEEVLVKYNPENMHGNVSNLKQSELQDLIEYVLSL